MTKLIKIAATMLLLTASASVYAWWDVTPNDFANDWMNGFFGDAEFSFHMRGNVFGNGYGRGNNYYYDRPYYGYGPYSYGPGIAPQAPFPPVEQSPQR